MFRKSTWLVAQVAVAAYLLGGLVAFAHARQDTSVEVCEGHLTAGTPVRSNNAQTVRQDFVDEYAEQVYISEEQNQLWIDRALDPNAPPMLYAVMENAWLKRLNDKVFKNKDLVTALTNYHKRLFLDALSERSETFGCLLYSDFKSIRLSCERDTLETRAAIATAFADANRKFAASALLNQILRRADRKGRWFELGFGQSGDQAALAARLARASRARTAQPADFHDGKLQATLAASLKRLKDLAAELKRDGIKLDFNTFMILRKAPETLDARLSELARLADLFSPSMLVAKRELLTVRDAPHGALSLDFLGLGAENLLATAQATIAARNVEDAIARARAGERKVTVSFERRKAGVKTIFESYFNGDVDVRFSGDDGVAIPNRWLELRDQLALLQALSKLMPRPYFRLTMIQANGVGDDSSQLFTHAESIEKAMRARVAEDLPALANQLSIEILNPASGKDRSVFLILHARRKLAEFERKRLRQDFAHAVEDIQNDVRAHGLDIKYRPADAYVLQGATPPPL